MDYPIPDKSFCCLATAGIQPPNTREQSFLLRSPKNWHWKLPCATTSNYYQSNENKLSSSAANNLSIKISGKKLSLISLDEHPISFQSVLPLNWAFTTTQLFGRLKIHLRNYSPITTRIWSFDVCPMSLPVLPTKFTLQSAVLQVNNFYGLYTATSVTETMQARLTEWYIPRSYV